MSKISKDDALAKLEEARDQLLSLVNAAFDGSIERLNREDCENESIGPRETVHTLYANPAMFKGTKPTAVIFDGDIVEVKTWRSVYTEILRRCASDDHRRAALMELRNKVAGRKRGILTDKPDSMDFPIKLAEELFVEADFDTEWLLRVLTNILNAVRYDYSDISVKIMHRKKR